MYRFLIADEETLFCSGLDLILRDLFIRASVKVCPDMDTLSKNLSDIEKNYDVLILDLQIAKLGNFGNLKRISEAASQKSDKFPVIVIGSDDSAEIIRASMDNGAHGYILKKSSTKILQLAINLVMDGEVYVPSSPFINQISNHLSAPVKLYGAENPLGGLTRRQLEVLTLIMDGQPNKQIALNLGLFENTVKSHVKAVLKKLNANNRTQAVIIATSLGLSSSSGSLSIDS